MIATPDQALLHPDPVPPALSPRESHLLAAFLTLRFDLHKFATQEALSPTDLLAFTHSAAIRAHLTNLRAFAEDSLSLRAFQSRFSALDALEEVAKATTDLIEKRLAATQILRTISPSRAPARGGRVCNPPSSSPESPIKSNHTYTRTEAAPSAPTPQPIHPSASLSSRAVAEILRSALNDLKSPQATASIHAFAEPGATAFGKPIPKAIDAFIESTTEAANPEPAIETTFVEPSGPTSPTTAAYTIIQKFARTPETKYRLKLTKCPNAVWRLTRLDRAPDTS